MKNLMEDKNEMKKNEYKQMVSGGALTGGSGGGKYGAGDSSESHDTDAPDETDSPPALRRRVNEKSRPQSELINQILIDKFKVKFANNKTLDAS